jgi:homoserine dehydrogenase
MVAPYKEKKLKTDDKKLSKYFLRLIVADERGVLAQITKILADADISLEQVLQQPYNGGKQAEIIMVTHVAAKSSLDQVIGTFSDLSVITEVKSCYRVEGGSVE